MMRMTPPILVISVLPLVAGVGIAWQMHQSQKTASAALALDVAGMRAGEEVAIGIRDVKTQLYRFLLTGDRKHLEAVPALRQETARWLAEAQRAAVTPEEQEFVARARKGYQHFFDKFDRIAKQPADRDLTPRVRGLMRDALINEILVPAQAYLDFNEVEIAQTNADNLRMTDRMVLGLLALGVCGPVSGVLAGFGIARRVTRSIGRLSVPVRDAAGKLNEIVGPITISARWGLEELEAVLHRIAEQTGAVVERLQQSQREVLRAEQLAAVGQMAAGMAHELRNPLMSMKLLVQAAAERSPSAVLDHHDLAVLEEEITRLERLVQTLLDFARPPQLEKQTFDARGLLEQTAGLVSGRAQQQGVRIECALPREPVVVQADVGQLRQVLLNLLLNALDALPNGGTVWLQMAAAGPGRWLTLRVADTGPGLPAGLAQRIFEPFLSTKETGIGLGLSICKRIIEAHGGEVVASDRPEGGALFTVRLPLSTAAECRSQRSEVRGQTAEVTDR
ncbi:MAG TPA: ATP-binding protein [Gemmataceae bacterium]|nr:ATP-binding protein [Gemmataceae bacterium]